MQERTQDAENNHLLKAGLRYVLAASHVLPVPPVLEEVGVGRRPGIERGSPPPRGASRFASFDAGAGGFREDPAATRAPGRRTPGAGPHALR